MRFLFAIFLCALTAGQSFAQDADWQFKATGYLWLPSSRVTVDSPRGSVSGELSVKDALDSLDFAFMGSFEARKERLSLIADLLYFNLSAEQQSPFGALFDRANIGTRITALTGLAAWRLHQSDRFAIDVGAGARAMWTKVDVALAGGALPRETSTRSDDWIDPIIALRARYDFSEKWYGTIYLDTGGFGVGSDETNQAAIGLGYNLNDKWSLAGGWRYFDFRRENNGRTFDMQQSGVIVGASLRF